MKSVQNLRLLLVRNAMHSIPFDQPRVTQAMFEEYISGAL